MAKYLFQNLVRNQVVVGVAVVLAVGVVMGAVVVVVVAVVEVEGRIGATCLFIYIDL